MSNNSVSKILIVVDVANCFISKGSFDFHQLNENKLDKNYQQIKEIVNLIDKNQHIVFTRDFHPQYHASLAYGTELKNKGPDWSVTYPTHCRNLERKCYNNGKLGIINKNSIEYDSIGKYMAENIENIPEEIISKIMLNDKVYPKLYILDKPIIGPELTFLYYGTKYFNVIDELLKNGKTYEIGLKLVNNSKNHKNEPNLEYINWNKDPFRFRDNTKTFIQLTKGQFCNYESYSAFNYHLKLTNNRNNTELKKEGIEAQEKNSTGLYEYITKKLPSENIEFTICGLVGDICVINTVLQGYLMVKKVYMNSKNIKFIYSLAGTLFVGNGINGFQLRPEINNDFIKLMKLRIKYLLENETFNDDLIYYEGFTFDLLDYESNKAGSFIIKIGERISTNNNKQIFKVKSISYRIEGKNNSIDEYNKDLINISNNNPLPKNYRKNLLLKMHEQKFTSFLNNTEEN